MKYCTRFKVAGKYPFPIDMLRYDACIPGGEFASNRIIETFHPMSLRADSGAVEVELYRIHQDRYWTPTEGRWNSFGWVVVANSIETEKMS